MKAYLRECEMSRCMNSIAATKYRNTIGSLPSNMFYISPY